MSIVEDATELRRQALTLRQTVTRPVIEDHLTHEQRAELWVAAKRAANALYSLCRDLDVPLLAEVGQTRGWKASDGTPVEVKTRFEVEVLDEDEFTAWAADQGVTPMEATWKVTPEARAAIREALLEWGEKVPGVSAGDGAPFLSLGRRS